MAYAFEQRFASYRASLAALREARTRDREDSFVLSGTSAKFAITYELAWKCMKDVLVEHYGISDFATGSPKDTLRAAFRMGLIGSDQWMEMHSLRNQLAHDYDLSTVRAAFERITSDYLARFDELESAIEALALAADDAPRLPSLSGACRDS